MSASSKSAQRRARKEELEARKKRNRRIIIGVVVAALVGITAFALTRPEPEELAATETFPDLGGGHLEAGEPTPDYNSNPATSGRHTPSAAACGIYTEELLDVVLVHNLEHGTIVVQYQSDIPEEDLEALREYARTAGTHILIAPREDLPSPVVITAWTRMLQMDTLDLDTLDVFYDRWARLGPEVGVACPFSIDQA